MLFLRNPTIFFNKTALYIHRNCLFVVVVVVVVFLFHQKSTKNKYIGLHIII